MFDGGGGSDPGGSIIEARNSFLERLDAVDLDTLAPDQLGAELKLVRSTIDLLELQAARRVAAFERSQAFYELGEHSTVDWIRTNTRLSAASADKQVTLARQLPELEPTVAAVEQGDISFEHALLIARQPNPDPAIRGERIGVQVREVVGRRGASQ